MAKIFTVAAVASATRNSGEIFPSVVNGVSSISAAMRRWRITAATKVSSAISSAASTGPRVAMWATVLRQTAAASGDKCSGGGSGSGVAGGELGLGFGGISQKPSKCQMNRVLVKRAVLSSSLVSETLYTPYPHPTISTTSADPLCKLGG